MTCEVLIADDCSEIIHLQLRSDLNRRQKQVFATWSSSQVGFLKFDLNVLFRLQRVKTLVSTQIRLKLEQEQVFRNMFLFYVGFPKIDLNLMISLM